MKYFFGVISICFLTLFLHGCRAKNPNQKPDHLLSKGEMTNLLEDMQLLEGQLHTVNKTIVNKDSIAQTVQKNYDLLFAKYHITKHDFEQNLHYYLYEIDDITKMYEIANRHIQVQDSLITVNNKQ